MTTAPHEARARSRPAPGRVRSRWLLACGLLASAACDRTASTPHARSLGIMYQVPVASFLPSATNQVEAVAFTGLGYERLAAYDSAPGVRPALATSWSSDDQRTWRFHLRQGVRFHDGTPFGAQDVVRSWRAALAAPPGSPSHPWMFDDVEGALAFSRGERADVDGLRVVDDSTLEVRLTGPYGDFPGTVADPAAAIVGPGGTHEHVNGTGPWRLLKGRPMDTTYAFVRNAHYWGAPARLDSLRIHVVTDSATFARALARGTLDCIPGANDFPALSLRPDYSLLASPPTWWAVVSLNHRHPLLRQVAYRQALSLALDRPLLARVANAPDAAIRASAMPPALMAWDTTALPVEHNVARARELLRAIPGSGTHILRIAWPLPDTTLGLLQTLRDELAAVGVRTRIQHTDHNASSAFLRDSVDLQLWRWMSPPAAPDALFAQLFHSRAASGLANAYAVNDREIDAALDRVRVMPVGAARDSSVVTLGRLLFERQPVLFLFVYPLKTAVSRRVTTCPSIAQLPTYTTVDRAR